MFLHLFVLMYTFNKICFLSILFRMLYSIDIDYGTENEIIIFDELKCFFNNHILCELDYYNDFVFDFCSFFRDMFLGEHVVSFFRKPFQTNSTVQRF